MKATSFLVAAVAALAVVAGCNRPGTETNRQAETFDGRAGTGAAVENHDRINDGMGRYPSSSNDTYAGQRADDDDAEDQAEKVAEQQETKGVGKAEIDDIELGRSLTAEGKIGDETSSFKAGEPVYVAVETEDLPAGSAVSAVLKRADGTIVAKEAKTLAADGEKFSVSKADGLPVGDYIVEITLADGQSKTEQFKVR